MKELDNITLERAKKGDRHAFRQLYDFYVSFIWKVLYSMGGRDVLAARELVQDTFVKVHASLHQFRGASAFSTWLYRIAYTTALAHARGVRTRPFSAVELDTLSGGERADTFDDRQLANRILASLSAEDRFLLVAREVNDISFDDLAIITGKNAGALRTQLHRIKENIRKSFKRDFLPLESAYTAGVPYEQRT